VLLLDEPFSNLDPGLRQQIRRDTLEVLRSTGATAIFVTHDQEEALFMGDVLAIMNRGRIEQIGSPEEIFHSPATRFIAQFIGLADFIPAWREEGRLVTDVGSMEWPLSAPQARNTDVDPAERLEVMVRPDCLNCHPSQEGQGMITDREFQGAFYLYRVSLPSDASVRCLLPHTEEYSIGTRVAVKLRQGHSLRAFAEDQAVPG
jgi:iron(III) transport system ATP-binding protein